MSTILYALINPAMPGLVKVGKTSRNHLRQRMEELYNTSVPFPFECVIAVEVEDDEMGDNLEKGLHSAFEMWRVNPKREFFEIEADQVKAILSIWPGGKDVSPQINKETEELPVEEREAAQIFETKKRRQRPSLNFEEMGIPDGSELVFTKEPAKKAFVKGAKKVIFDGEEMSLTMAAQKALGPDYITKAIRGTSHFSYEDRPLVEIYEETYDQQDIEPE